MAVPDPDLEIRGGGGGPFGSQFGLKIKGAGPPGPPDPSPGTATEWQLPGIAFSKVSFLLGIQTVQFDYY